MGRTRAKTRARAKNERITHGNKSAKSVIEISSSADRPLFRMNTPANCTASLTPGELIRQIARIAVPMIPDTRCLFHYDGSTLKPIIPQSARDMLEKLG
jgi:DeoR/GlpR family transcriptional regulator of sugar metabolism